MTTLDHPSPEEAIKARARALGFDAVGIARVDAAWDAGEGLAQFVALERHGDMDWMETTLERRRHPRAMWPEARSAIVVGLNYAPPDDPMAGLERATEGVISVYARGGDYHDVIKPRLKQLAGAVADATGADVKVFVDTAPLMEKPLAALAGVGWQGKHTNLVSRDHGSWLFLGVVLTSAELAPDAPETDHCGSCRACLDICPTDAFPAPYQLDARRCISYLTIEHKGPIPRELREAMGNRIYGCDDCLAVCPWNKFAAVAHEAKLFARAENIGPPLGDLAGLDDAGFREVYAGSPIKRIGRDRFVRNVAVAIGNSGDGALLRALDPLLEDASPLVRGAAVWALWRLADRETFFARYERRLRLETDAGVQEEWEAGARAWENPPPGAAAAEPPADGPEAGGGEAEEAASPERDDPQAIAAPAGEDAAAGPEEEIRDHDPDAAPADDLAGAETPSDGRAAASRETSGAGAMDGDLAGAEAPSAEEPTEMIAPARAGEDGAAASAPAVAAGVEEGKSEETREKDSRPSAHGNTVLWPAFVEAGIVAGPAADAEGERDDWAGRAADREERARDGEPLSAPPDGPGDMWRGVEPTTPTREEEPVESAAAQPIGSLDARAAPPSLALGSAEARPFDVSAASIVPEPPPEAGRGPAPASSEAAAEVEDVSRGGSVRLFHASSTIAAEAPPARTLETAAAPEAAATPGTAGEAPASAPARLARRIIRAAAMAVAATAVLLLAGVAAYRMVEPPFTLTMAQRALGGAQIRRAPVPLERISPHLVRAVIAAEDSRFCAHKGFDGDAIAQAIAQARNGGRLRGASTLSQQTAKNAFLWSGGGWPRKGVEAGLTSLVELTWSKRRIMEVYLNAAEWGDGLFGAEAAAQARFGVSAADLTPRQAALLAAVLPSPNLWRLDPPGEYVRSRAATLEARMHIVERDGLADCVLRDG